MAARSRPRARLVASFAIVGALTMLAAACSGSSPAASDTAGTGPTAANSSTPAGRSTAAAAPTQVGVAFGFLMNVEYSGNFVADDAGYYAEAGIVPKFLAGGPNAPAPEVSIASGQAQIAYESNTSRLFNYLADNNDIVVIGQVFQRSPNGLVSLKARPVRTAEELKGASIIAGSANRSSIDALMALNNVTDYTFVPGGADIGALQARQGDALLSFASNQPVALAQQGLTADQDFYFVPFSDLNYYLMSDVIIVSRSFLESHRDVVVGFLKASAKGWETVFNDPRAAAELTVNKYATDQGLDVDRQEAVVKAQIPYMTSDLTKSDGLFAVEPAFVQDKVYPSLTKAGISKLPEVSKVIDMTVLADAQK